MFCSQAALQRLRGATRRDVRDAMVVEMELGAELRSGAEQKEEQKEETPSTPSFGLKRRMADGCGLRPPRATSSEASAAAAASMAAAVPCKTVVGFLKHLGKKRGMWPDGPAAMRRLLARARLTAVASAATEHGGCDSAVSLQQALALHAFAADKRIFSQMNDALRSGAQLQFWACILCETELLAARSNPGLRVEAKEGKQDRLSSMLRVVPGPCRLR